MIKEMEEKRKHLKVLRFCSIRPVLIHVNRGKESVLGEGYFDKVIDFSHFLG